MNRYSQISGHGLQLPMMQLPYEKLDDLLGQQQANIQMTDALMQKAPKYIPESTFATSAAAQINKYQEDVKNKLTEIAKTGDVSSYMKALQDAQTKVANLYRPGGLAYNLEQDYATYQAYNAKEQERLAKGEIMPEVYQRGISEPLKAYDRAAGSKRYNPTLKPQSVKFDDFAKDFVKNYQDDKYNKGDLQIINDRVFYRNTEVSGVEAQRVLQGLSQAYKNAASGTGQLEDLFQARNQDNAIIQQYRNTSIEDATKTLDVIKSLNTKDKESVKKVQRLLNNIGLDTGGVDGDYGPKTQAALDVARNTATDILNNVPNMKDEELFDKAKDKFINSHINQLASPYADATARRKEEIKWTDMGETEARFRREEDYKSKKRMEEANPFIPPTTGYTETVSNPFFNDIDEIKFKDGKPVSKSVDKTIEANVPSSTSGTGFSTFGSEKRTLKTGEIREINEKELDIIDGIKKRHKDLYGKDMTDAQLERTYNALVQDRKSIKTIYNQYTDNKQKKNRTEVVLGDEKSLLNAGSRPLYVLSPNGQIIPKSTDEIIDMLGTDILGKGIEGEIAPDNPFGAPTGDYATAVDKTGRQVAIVIGNRSIEEDSYMSAANQLSKSKYSLKPETVIIKDEFGRPTGAKLRSIPVIQTDEDGNYQGVDATIEVYDNKQNLLGTKPLSEYIKEKQATNPYSNK